MVYNEGDMDDWQLLLDGRSEEALLAFKAAALRHPSTGTLNNLGLALLDLGRFKEAVEVFMRARAHEMKAQTTSETTLVNLGISHWCDSDRSAALRDWELSLNTIYADEAGGVQGPAMLWFGATEVGDMSQTELALKVLKKLWKPRVLSSHSWPGPVAIAGFLLGEVKEEKFIQGWSDANPMLEVRRRCKVHFWAGAKSEETILAAEHFRLACSDRAAILEPEFFLARYLYAQHTELSGRR